MKPLSSSPSPISLIKSSRKTTRVFSVILSLLIVNLFSGCTYFKVKDVTKDEQKSQISWLQEFNQAQKFIVLHQPGISLHLKNAYLDGTNYELKGIPSELPPEHTYKDTPEIGKGYRYKKQTQSPLNEVHLYIDNKINMSPGQALSIPIASIEKIGYSEKDVVRGVANVFGIVIGTLALATVIVALTKSSCPFIYADNGQKWVFEGELYPGNIYESAQRTNYLKLPNLVAIDGFYHLQITNELLEIQHTDEAVLEVVDHPNSVTVGMDPSGTLYTIGDPMPPVKAIADEDYDLLQEVIASDDLLAGFNTPLKYTDNKRRIDFWFEHDRMQTNAKLVLNVKNSLWLDYVMGQFYEQFGNYFPTFQEKRQTISMEEAYQWREDQSLPLSVYVNKGDKWELQHTVYAVGPLKFQEIVLPIDLSALGDEPLKIRLETGFMFWELDKLGVDYSENLPIHKIEVLPGYAVDNYQRDVSRLLEQPDQKYLTQTEVGDWVEIRYQSPPEQGEDRTVFLRNRGYYTYVRDFKGDPDFAELRRFRKPGYFTSYSEENYNALLQAIMKMYPKIVTSDESY